MMSDVEQMLIFAVRHALTKSNYVVSVTVNYLLENDLSTQVRQIIANDIKLVYPSLYTLQQQQWGRVLKAWNIKL